MLKRLFFFILPLLIASPLFADVVSLEGNFVQGESNVVAKLNRDRNALANSVNNVRGVYVGGIQSSGQIKAATIGEENMADDANPRVFTNELFIAGKLDGNNGVIYQGCEYQPSLNLSSSATSCTAYTDGYRTVTSSSAHTFGASKWTYAFICSSGSFSYLERAIGTDITSAEYPAGCQPISRVSTDNTRVLAVKDLRKTKFTFESYDSVYDADTESSLKELLVGRTNPYKTGAMLSYSDASSFTVTAGAAMIGGEARDRASYTSDPSWPVASTSELDGLDVGLRNDGTYYVYLVADAQNQRPYTVVHSANPNAPAGKTKYLKVGEFYTNGGTISRDSVISYLNGSNVLKTNLLMDAWLSFSGKGGAVSHVVSKGVSAVNRTAQGVYQVVWEDPFVGRYAVGITVGRTITGSSQQLFANIADGALVDNSVTFKSEDPASQGYDSEYYCVMAIGG